MKNNKTQMIKNMILCIIAIIMLCFILTSCTLQDPITESTYYIKDSETNYYLQDHTTSSEAVDEFTNSITQLRKYLNSESFVDTGYYMGVNFGIDILDVYNNTVGNFQLKISSYLYTYPYEDEEGNFIYKYYERGNYYDENNAEGTRTLVSALEIHNEAIKKSDFSIEWFNGATNEVMIGLYFDGINSDSSNPGNILYVNIQGYKRSYANFGDTVLFQQMIRLLTSLSVEGLLESLGLQADAGTGSINSTMSALIGDNYKKVLNGDLTSLLFYSVTLDAISSNVTNLLDRLLGVFGRKWDPMTLKYLGFKFSTVANAIITSINADMQAIISPDKENVEKVLTDALFAFNGVLSSAGTMYTYTSNIQFDYGWEYPEDLTLDMLYYTPFVNGNFEFEGTLYIPLLDTQYDALIRTDMNRFDNSTNNVFIEFRDIANGELMIGLYYKNETTYLDITGLEYLYGWIDLEALGFPQVYDTSFNLATFLKKLAKTVDNIIISIVDSILDPESSDRENKLLEYIMLKTTFTEKLEEDIFSKNTETLQVDIELVKQVLEETGAGTYSTRQIINIIDSVSPYSMDQLAIMLGVSSAEVMLEKTYFLLTWDVDSMQMTLDMFSNVGVDVEAGEPSTEIFRLEVMPVYFGETVIIADIDFSNFVPLGKIYTYSGTLKGAFVFSSQETVDLSKLLSATFGESSGLNTPYVLASNAGLSFTMIYDQFVTDQYVDGVLKKSGRSAFTLTVWLTGSESSIIITLASDDVSFNNEVYKDLPAREAELGYVWVDIECVTKNGVQTIPKLKIREDIFMSSMSAYMNNETSITDDVSSFADNDFNLSLTSIITALCKDAYVVPEPEQLEITSSNDTLQSLFRVNGLIGNIAVDAGFTYRVKGLESIKSQYYMYEVGFFDNIEGENPYNTELHHDLRVTFYEDYMSSYAPLDYDFYVFRKDTIIDEDSYIAEGTIMVFKLGAKKTVSRETIEYGSNSFFNHESAENQDITRVKFKLTALNFINFNNEENYYYYFDYTNSLQIVDDNYIEVGNDGTIYIYWLGINEFLFYESGASYYYYDMSQALEKDGDYVYIYPTTTRDLLFEYDKDSVEITEACKTQYAPRTNGSFMGEVRRYFVILSSSISAELGKITSLYYSPVDAEYAQYYSEEDKNNIEYEYDEDGVLINQELRPIQLFVMEPCEELQTTVTVNVQTSANTVEYYTFNCRFGIDWDIITTKGYMLVTDVVVAPGMMGEIAFPVRIIVTNREIDALGDSNETATVFASSTEFFTKVPVVDEFDLDPYDYILAKYEYLSNTDNFNVNNYANNDTLLAGYKQAVNRFVHDYFAKITFNINFLWETSYLYLNGIDGQYIKQTYSNYNSTTDTLTRYEWSFDEFGNNMEEAVNEDGGTVYLHTYFFGQLICIKVNIGKRMFSHIKFGRTDDFNVDSFNENSGYDYTINGKYYANYYDNNSYEISRTPIFVFVDNSGNEYEHVFDMSIITGLVKNTSGAYTGTYEILEQYELGWQYTNITNITSSGSYFQEYPYERLYSDTEFTLTTTLYSALSETSKQIKVDYIQTNGTVVYDGFYYVADGSGYAKYRKSISYQDLKTLLENAGVDTINSYVDVDYNNGKAYLFTKDASGNAFVRQENKEIQNRPFYYYYAIGDSDKEVVYLTEDEYEAFWDDTNPNYATVRSMYVFDTAIASEITNTTLNLYGLLRLYYTFDTVNMNSISIVSNSLIDLSQETPADSVGKNFSYIPVRVIVECPILQLESLSYDENDEITGETFTPNKVETSVNSAAGYYLVDPLDPSTLVLPKSLTIYFNDINTGNESSHTFDGIEWAAYFDANNDPVYTVTNTNSQDVTLLTYNPTTKETTIALNLDEIDGTLKFKLQAKIGNEISGYKFVNVCIRILSKDPTMVKFYTGTNKELEVEQIITSMAYGAASPLQTTYYAYYLNTFENFVLPTSLVATFSDGHSTTYPAHWVLASTESESWVYAPNTILTLMTVIGADNDTGTSGIEVNIYLSIIVRNFDLNAIQANNTYSNYYVNLQSTTDANHIIKKRLSDILKYQKNTKTIGYYFEDAGETYYIRISDGTTAYDCDKGVGENRIGLYTFNGSDYLLVNTISVYDFLVELYSSATITVEESTMDYDNFTIINKSTSIYDYTIESYFESTTSNIQLRRMVEIVYNYDNATNENSIRVNLQTIEGGNTYYPVVTDGKVTLHNLSGGSLVMSYAELLTYIITQGLAFDFTDWKISEINGVPFNDPEDKDSDNDGIKNELGEYILFNKTRGITLYPIINIDTAGSIKLSNQNETETVTYSYYELMYRLDHLYRHVLITEAESTINNKEFEINDLYKVMDITDLLYNDRNTTYSNKYIIPLGVNQGSYNINARIQFVGGLYYNGSYSENIETATIQAYTNRGVSQYEDGYILANNERASIHATYNGSTIGKQFSYNYTATDALLTTWKVEYISDDSITILSVGDLITAIPAEIIYRTNINDVVIRLSTLTDEGFRIYRHFNISYLSNIYVEGFNGRGTLTISDGVVIIDNIYEYVDDATQYMDAITKYFGSNEYLPKSVSLSTNARTITIDDIEWNILTNWRNRLNTLTYKGVEQTYMAEATILGAVIDGVRYGAVTLRVSIKINTTSVAKLPWSNTNIALNTETVFSGTSRYYVVYFDPILNASSNTITEHGTLTLPADLLVQYEDGQLVTFKNITYKYNSLNTITKIFYTTSGIDTAKMISPAGELQGYSELSLSKRYLDLTVNLGLSQDLNIRFYFYDRTLVVRTENSIDYTDMMAEIKLDDVNIRNVISNGLSDKLSNYSTQMVSELNTIRIISNLKEIIDSAQEIKSAIQSYLDTYLSTISITAQLSETRMIELLIGWQDTISYKGADLNNLPTSTAYSSNEAYDFALKAIIDVSNNIYGSYLTSIKAIAIGAGTATAKKTRVITQLESYISDITTTGYNQVITNYIAKEYENVFYDILANMNDEELNNAIYYKNMVEAGFNVDTLLKDMLLIKNVKADANAAIKNEVISSLLLQLGLENYEELVAKYTTSEVVIDDYDDVILLAILNGIETAFRYANSLVDTKSTEMQTIMAVVRALLTERLDLEYLVKYYLLNETSAIGESNAINEFTLKSFIDTALDSNRSKKFIRLYFINAMALAMDFTQVSNEEWNNTYIALSDEIIKYSFSSISNYDASVTAIRKGLISGSNVTSLVNNLIKAGVKSFINTVYLESQIAIEVKNLQRLNKILVNGAGQIDEDDYTYTVDPYMNYAIATDRIVIYFDDENGGYPYVTTVVWTLNTLNDNISYNGYTTDLVGSPYVPAVSGLNMTVTTKAECIQYAFDTTTPEITTGIYEELAEVVNSHTQFAMVPIENNTYVVYISIKGSARAEVIVFNARKAGSTISVNREDYSSEDVKYFAEFNKFDTTFKLTTFSGFDYNGDIMYTFKNERDMNVGSSNYGTIVRQIMSVYNPFEFSRSTDLPSKVVVSSSGNSSTMDIVWNNIDINPKGNLSNNSSSQIITGNIGSSAGQSISMYLLVAKWEYARFYTKTNSDTTTEYVIDGDTYYIRTMSPISIYFTKYMDYSSEDWYVIYFKASINVLNGNTSTTTNFVFDKEIKEIGLEISKIKAIDVNETGKGFVDKLFYPEDSRLLQYTTSDETMAIINKRMNYVMYWDAAAKNSVINNALPSRDNCIISLGNAKIGQYSLTALKDTSSVISTATYCYEDMNILKGQIVKSNGVIVETNEDIITFTYEELGYVFRLNTLTLEFTVNGSTDVMAAVLTGTVYSMYCTASNSPAYEVTITYDTSTQEATCSARAWELYEDIKSELMNSEGQMMVVMSPNTYYPTDGDVLLFYNHISYDKENINVRLIWNLTYTEVISKLINFIQFAYEDIEESARETYAIDILMGWNKLSKEEQNEMIALAVEYCIEQYSYTGNYTLADAYIDAYKLLAINEAYDITKDVQKLMGGANNNVRVTMLIRVNDNVNIYRQSMVVKVLFMDYTPINYYTYTVGVGYTQIDTIPGSNVTDLYIGVRTDYWMTTDVDGYTYNSATTPYDNISDTCYKLLQYYVETRKTDINGDPFVVKDGYNLIHITNIVWDYNAATKILTSRTFTINNKTYSSNMLSIKVA